MNLLGILEFIVHTFITLGFCLEKYCLKAVTVSLWKSESPVSETSRFELRGQFVRSRYIHEGFQRLLKQVLCFIKFFKLYILINSDICFPLLRHWNHSTGLNFHGQYGLWPTQCLKYSDEKWFYLHVHYLNNQEAIFYFLSLILWTDAQTSYWL